MNTGVLEVRIDEQHAGVLEATSTDLTFRYADEYLELREATPLSVSMPLAEATYRSATVTPWLWGLLPERADVLARWAREFQASASSPFSLLATPVGEDCPGGVQFIRPERRAKLADARGDIDWLDEGDVAERLAALRVDATLWLGPDFTGQFSLGGAQAKTALHLDDGRWGVPSGSIPTTHILKPAIAGLDDHDLNEHLCLRGADNAGLVVAQSRVVRFRDETAVVVDRYDRTIVGGRVVRVHQEDLCQAVGVLPASKYEADGGPGVAQVGKLLRATVTPRAAESAAVESFLDALIWNWVIGGTDAHAKNYALLLSGRRVRLAPLYDIASVLPYEHVDELKLKMAMKLGDEYRLKAHRGSTWRKVADDLALDRDHAVDRARDLVTRAPDALADAARADDVQVLESELPARLVDAVASRRDRCLKQLMGLDRFASRGEDGPEPLVGQH